MRLLSLCLQGNYKSLKDQTFSFDDAEGSIIALIGLNGSGKSQLLELIAETFGYIERCLRSEFKCRNWFDSVALEIIYTNQPYDSEEEALLYSVNIDFNGQLTIQRNGCAIDLEYISEKEVEEIILPSDIIGYSSGQNENLQRPFMKNAVQYLDVMNVKRSWERRLTAINEARNAKGKYITESDLVLFDRQLNEAYSYYHNRHPTLFPEMEEGTSISDNAQMGIRPTALPRLKYFDQDATALMLVSMGMMDDVEQNFIWRDKQRFNKIYSVKLRYDLRKFTYETGALLDIAKLIKSVGGVDSEGFVILPRTQKTSEEFYNQFELDYLSGEIIIDYGDELIKQNVLDGFFSPKILFEKLYRLQLLAADFWLGETKRKLREDSFSGSAKKPQKWKSPIQVVSLKLTDGNQCIEFEDLSDGEAQLIQMLSMASIYRGSRTLFLLDEPETHLNPLWRTYFHSYIEDVIGVDNKRNQLFVSTHSPFMVSSLKRNNVYQFRRNENGLIDMRVPQNETYGASFDVLVKNLFELRSLISHSVIEEIREQLKQGDSHAKKWIESNLGLSAERSYLLRKLSQ